MNMDEVIRIPCGIGKGLADAFPFWAKQIRLLPLRQSPQCEKLLFNCWDSGMSEKNKQIFTSQGNEQLPNTVTAIGYCWIE
jgi:hypothetical protein